eukprot:1171778-Lingulodinium_polyedra.AAC.1
MAQPWDPGGADGRQDVLVAETRRKNNPTENVHDVALRAMQAETRLDLDALPRPGGGKIRAGRRPALQIADPRVGD